MEHAVHLPNLPSRKSMVAPVVALVIGAGAATGAYALIDDGNQAASPGQVIVVQRPAEGSAQIPGKNEAATAAAIGGTTDTVKDEASIAASVSAGSKASDTGSTDSTPGRDFVQHFPLARHMR